MSLVHDYSETDRLDAAFAAKRHAEAYATRAEARGTLVKGIGVASLLGGAGLGMALFGASFLIVPKERLAGEETVRGVLEPAPDISPYAAKTPEEDKFVERPEYKAAQYHGRIVKSVDGRSLSFQDGQNFSPAHWDPRTQKSVGDPDKAFDSDAYVGDLGMCVPDKDHKELWECTALHNGHVVDIHHKPYDWKHATTAALDMVAVDIKVNDYPVEAMVDTGCAFPVSVPKIYADALVRAGLATRTGTSSTTFADGSSHEVGIIMINAITVEGRVLHDVEASVSPNNEAPILLGLGALNRLGPFGIVDGKLVFTGEQPA